MPSRTTARPRCSPSYATARSPERPNRTKRVERILSLRGITLMPWQRQVVDVATEYNPATGRPMYRTIALTTPRQQGKTTTFEAFLLDRCVGWGAKQACVWTGQDGASIRKKFLNEIVPDWERSQLGPLIDTVRRANGSESVEWATGSRVDLLPTTETAGHGMVIDFAVLDEIFADTDNRREAALLPAMATRRDAQMLVCSTAGTAASTVYNRIVRQGRQAVSDGIDEGFAYFEWSAPDGWDPDDEESWWSFMPALGHTITPEVVRQARRALDEEPGEFVRAFGNRPQIDGSEVIPEPVWRRVVDPQASVSPQGARIGVEVGTDRDVAAIAVADESTVELIEYRSGPVGWVVPRLEELTARYGGTVTFDGRGPASGLDGIMSVRGANPLSSGQVAEACSGFFDAVVESQVRVRQENALDAAVRGVARRQVGDRFVWARRGSRRDVTPLFAVTMAWAGGVAEEQSNQGFAFVMGDR